jgi:glutamyl-tRNA synthetase
MKPRVVGRLAPSPTGAQHLGNARTYLIAWLAARALGGRVLLRIEDIDSPRVKPWAIQQAMDDLAWLGLDWDAGPDKQNLDAPTNSIAYMQTARLERYREGLDALQSSDRIYPCTCTRTDIEQAASAPHRLEGESAWIDGPVYPGNCSGRSAYCQDIPESNPFAWRFRCYPGVIDWSDGFCGPQSLDASKMLGDFVVGKKDGWPAYQLAVVMDDHDMEVSMVVRGNDLIPSTYRQMMLYRFFGWKPPQFFHVPLVVGTDGKRLAKRHGDTRLSTFRDKGIDSRAIIGWLALGCGWISAFKPLTPKELIPLFRWESIPQQNLICPDDIFDFGNDLPRFENDA